MNDLAAKILSLNLSNKWLGLPIQYQDQVDSTNTRLRELARQGGTHGTVLVADSQTGGRGRLERKWHSPPGKNLYFSVLLRPSWLSCAAKPLSLAAAVALAEATETILSGRPVLKWPNDLLWQGRKLAGILVESATGQQTIRYAIVGIGLNVNQSRFPDALAKTAGSLCQVAGHPLDRTEVLAQVLHRLEWWIDLLESAGAKPVLTAWQRYASMSSEIITVQDSNRTITGTALGLTADGALRLRDHQGKEHLIVAGDVVLGPGDG
jgi:BirA family transcriptional regulator, biotin operon repressor / biotin---[acetyl-CoA-carboxylase] ligase